MTTALEICTRLTQRQQALQARYKDLTDQERAELCALPLHIRAAFAAKRRGANPHRSLSEAAGVPSLPEAWSARQARTRKELR
jgi:hypothetical protein